MSCFRIKDSVTFRKSEISEAYGDGSGFARTHERSEYALCSENELWRELGNDGRFSSLARKPE